MFKHIEIPVSKFVKALPPTPDFDPIYRHVRLELADLEEEFVEWQESKGLQPKTWLNPILFYAHPNTRTSVHTDNGGILQWSLNIVLGDSDVEMQWRKAEGGEVKNPDLDYTKFSDDTPIVKTTRLGRTLCRIGVPHVSFNHGPGVWILSLRTAPVGWFDVIRKFP